ncbi:UBC-like protein [Desarmillaria tabescens]|uniref:Ubiquitin-conjugating enzyme E2 6 n=1 Tax=Armillaria tabescens TaxID=1929756 RepID=A0AA39N415_ARMTA|nr:UBC-like protein [Desarmillaria tabescens]KAK0457396.1 UBC-like protein [Desarmillaria tabescens]
MATKAASKRLSKEYVTMQREPPPFVWAVPDEKNILTWNYIIRGPPDSPFAGGEYHGLLLFPSEYPFKPPGIKMLTPSGRFHPDKKICFSMSDFHPGSWNPAWSVATILTGLLSFMLSDEMTTGSVTSSDTHKRTYAQRSHGWNLTQARFKEAFPDYCTPQPRDLPNMGERERGIIKAPVTLFPSAPQPTTPAPQTVVAKPAPQPTLAVTPTAPTVSAASVPRGSIGKPDEAANAVGWASGWSQLFWQKWRWGILIALAVIVSKISSKD